MRTFDLAPDGRVFHTPGFRYLHRGSIFGSNDDGQAPHGLEHEMSFHTLRHTSRRPLLIREGAHPKVIQVLMGHSSVKTTLDIYGHLFPGFGDEFAARLHVVRSGDSSTSFPLRRRPALKGFHQYGLPFPPLDEQALPHLGHLCLNT